MNPTFEIGELVVRLCSLPKKPEDDNDEKPAYDVRWGWNTKIDGYKISDADTMSDIHSTKSTEGIYLRRDDTRPESPVGFGDLSHLSSQDDDSDSFSEKQNNLRRLHEILNASSSSRSNTALSNTSVSMKLQMGPEMFDTNSILITASTSTTVDQLKEKLSSALPGLIPTERMMLLFQGTTLRDGKKRIPIASFEINGSNIGKEGFNEDLLVFRPRLYLVVIPPPDVEEPEEEPEEEEEEVGFTIEEDEAPEEEKIVVEDVILSDRFIMTKEMSRIDCTIHTEQLIKAGYGEEGAFSELTEEALTSRDVIIPRRARVRILNLADVLKRRLAEEDAQLTISQYAKMENAMLKDEKLMGVTIDGDESGTVYNKKADYARAWAANEKRKIEEKNRQRFNPDVEKERKGPSHQKLHAEGLAKKIEQIKWRCELDDEGIPLTFYEQESQKRTAQRNYCCDHHRQACAHIRDSLILKNKMRNQIDLTMTVKNLPTLRSGFVSSDTLAFLTKSKLQGTYNLPPEQITDLLDSILNKCKLNLHDQREVMKWVAQEEIDRDNLSNVLPIEQYDAVSFVKELVDICEKIDKERI